MKLAKDLMTSHPTKVQSGSYLRDVIKTFVEDHISSAPVITPNSEIIGVMTELGLVKAALKKYLRNGQDEKVIHHKELLVDAVTVDEETSLADVLKTMLKAPSQRVLVTNGAKKLVGIISPKDVLHFVYGEAREVRSLRQQLEDTQQRVDELEDKLESTEEVLERYENLFHDSPALLHSVNKEGTIVMANQRLHRILEYEDGELIGKKVTELYAESCHHEALEGLRVIQEQGSHHGIYSTMVTKTGKKIRVDLVSTALRDHHGKFLATITASRPIDSEALLRALHGALEGEEKTDPELGSLMRKVGSGAE